MRFFFFYGCALLAGMYLLGTTSIFPWKAFLDDDYGGSGYSRGGYYYGGGYHK